MSNKDKGKTGFLKESGTFNPNASAVKDELFTKNDFFDPGDMMQIKYEILRRVSKEKSEVKEAVRLFGMSRQYYYKIKAAFDQKGIAGLLPGKRGPKQPFKLTDEIIVFIEETIKKEPSVTNQRIAERIESQFKLSVHPRTIERMRKGQKKTKGRI